MNLQDLKTQIFDLEDQHGPRTGTRECIMGDSNALSIEHRMIGTNANITRMKEMEGTAPIAR
ncbi:MAG: hypothetical protein VX910_10945 [Candidatus Latescibacterota bacterium]|nr:hypothetical protein [Candidatus Latescibacterota bacterium]